MDDADHAAVTLALQMMTMMTSMTPRELDDMLIREGYAVDDMLIREGYAVAAPCRGCGRLVMWAPSDAINCSCRECAAR